MPEQDMTALAFAAGRGDRDAVTALIRATQRDLMRFLSSLTSPGDVEDLTQETYLRAVRALPQFAGHSSVRTWLFSIGRRVAADHIRQATRRPRLAAVADWQSAAENVAATTGTRFDEQQALTDLVAGLLPERRIAFVATQIAGLSYAEAAEVCGCPVGTIRSRVARAREDLVTAMNKANGPQTEVAPLTDHPIEGVMGLATKTASAVVMGTAATRPIVPTALRRIS